MWRLSEQIVHTKGQSYKAKGCEKLYISSQDGWKGQLKL